MKQIENTSIYKADEGCFIVRKEDNFIMGEEIDLGSADSIDNYEDQEYTDESYELFYESIGMKSPKALKKAFEEMIATEHVEPKVEEEVEQ